MSSEESDTNPYELLGVAIEATEQEIKSAYRKLSLKVHPDRNPNNPQAAQKFHELNQTYELLLDPLRRSAVTSRVRAKEARRARFAQHDAKRKNLQDELEERERAFKKQKFDKVKEARARDQENERIQEAGRKLREEKEKELLKRQSEAESVGGGSEHDADVAPPVGQHDTTIKLKYLISAHPSLKTSSSIVTLLSQFGEVDASSIVISIKPPKKTSQKSPKYGTAVVEFKQIGDAFAAVCASGRKERGLEDVEVTWAGGKEPPILGWLKRQGKLELSQTTSNEAPSKPSSSVSADTIWSLGIGTQTKPVGTSFSSFPETLPSLSESSLPRPSAAPGLDYESLTLMRLRQAERARLEREILEQEAKER